MWPAVTILVACVAITGAQESRTVTLLQGAVRGYKPANSEVFQFWGIPYATAPKNTDKFKAPLPPPTWVDSTLEAIDDKVGCPQNPVFHGDLNIKEDCLVANVFMPSNQTTPLPVVVIVHGGAFVLGEGATWSPRPMVESQKIVAVSINYRLGPPGFLCLGTEDIPGNAGLKDILAALRWVRDNIAHFGGNPEDVTLSGSSAGAAAVDLLGLSKAADGLFNKLILESGTHVAGWAVQMDPIKKAQEYAQKLKFTDVDNLTALEEFYKTISNELLLSDISSFESQNSDFNLVPCIEADLGQERILDDSPINIIRSSEYRPRPSLYGFANMEGLIRAPEFDDWAPKMNKNFSEFLNVDMSFENETEKEEVAQIVKKFYFGDKTVGLYQLFNYIDYFSDTMFAYPVLRSIKLQVEAGNDQIFLYEYTFYNNYISEPGVPDILINFPGAAHIDQTYALLENIRESNEERYTEEYKQMRTTLRELWVNFITNGTPVLEGSPYPAWPPTNASCAPHMILGDSIELGGALNERRALFWDAIYGQYYRHPMPPTFVESEEGPNSADIMSGSIVRIIVFTMLMVHML